METDHKKTTLLVTNDKMMNSIYSLNLDMYVGSRVVIKEKQDDAINFLKKTNECGLIIVKSMIDNEPAARGIMSYMDNESDRIIPMLVIGEDSEIKGAEVLGDSPELKMVIKKAASALGVTAEYMAGLKVPDYYPIPASHFRGIMNVACDVFVREASGNYLSKFSTGVDISIKDVDDLIARGVTTLHVPSGFRLRFAKSVSDKYIDLLKKDNLSVEERVEVTDEALNAISDQLRNSGLAEETILLAQQSIQSISKVVEESKTLAGLLAAIMNNKTSYQYKHCQLITFVCFHILKNMEWGTKEQQDKLGFVSFFHDIVLQNDEMVRISDEEELADSNLSDKEKKIVKRHALLAADLVKDHPKLPLGAEVIIKQHHGSRTGIGFNQMSTSVSPLAVVFVVAEEWTQIVLDAQEKEKRVSKKKVLGYLKEKYSKGPYSKVVDALESLEMNF